VTALFVQYLNNFYFLFTRPKLFCRSLADGHLSGVHSAPPHSKAQLDLGMSPPPLREEDSRARPALCVLEPQKGRTEGKKPESKSL